MSNGMSRARYVVPLLIAMSGILSLQGPAYAAPCEQEMPMVLTRPNETFAGVERAAGVTVPPAYSADLTGARFVRVARTIGDSTTMVNETLNPSAPVLTLPDDAILQIVGPPLRGAGVLWLNVRGALGNVGYVAAENVAPIVDGPQSTSPGQPAMVGNTGGQGVFLRRTPNLDDHVVALPDNTVLEIVGDEQACHGQSWKAVRDSAGNLGYLPAEFVVPLQ